MQGQVLEKSTNAPVVGASVIIKGTTSGTITDLDGNQRSKNQAHLSPGGTVVRDGLHRD